MNATINLRFPCNARDHVTSQSEHIPWSYLVTFGSSNEEASRVNKFVWAMLKCYT